MGGLLIVYFTSTRSITNSDLNRPCFAWRPYGKSGLFKTELVIRGYHLVFCQNFV